MPPRHSSRSAGLRGGPAPPGGGCGSGGAPPSRATSVRAARPPPGAAAHLSAGSEAPPRLSPERAAPGAGGILLPLTPPGVGNRHARQPCGRGMKQVEERAGSAGRRAAAAARPPRPSALTGALWGSPPQALVDDTEDVSLDFGSEEELALRKAKIR